MMSQAPVSPSPVGQPPAWRGWVVFLAAVAATFVLGLLASSIFQRRQEAALQSAPLVPIAALETDNARWGQNYPRQHASYLQTEDSTTRTKYGGADPRDYLEETPANVILFAGYGFSKDYKQARGHVHSIEDINETARTGPQTPATCWTCKSTDVVRLMSTMGPSKFYQEKWADLKHEVTHPIGCLDCHDPTTMNLRITRPALIEAFKRMGRDIQHVSHQEMRSLVCAQCHVEYHFRPGDNYLLFSWDKGLRADQMDEYFEENGFTDWTHPISKAKMVKMQHPDYEVYSTGIHAFRNVSCADCHMPYRTEGGAKFTDHRHQSPLLNIANSCAVCHRWSEDDVRQRVTAIQDKVREGRTQAETVLTKAHFDIAAASQAGGTDAELESARHKLRKAQLYWDYVAANNGMGFHSPQECQRVLGKAVDLGAESRLEAARVLARHGHTQPIDYPDFGSKEKAQALAKLSVEGKLPSLLGKK